MFGATVMLVVYDMIFIWDLYGFFELREWQKRNDLEVEDFDD